MAAVATFIRHTPKTALQSYFEKEAFHLDPPVNWAAPEREIIKPLLQAVDQMSELERDRLVTVFDRVAAMSDEVGFRVIEGRKSINAIQEELRRQVGDFLAER